MKSVLVSLIVFTCIFAGVEAQEISKYDLERRAENHFERQRYLKASGDYEILYNMYPKDAKYAYYLGRSYLHSNRYLGRATDLLKFSARRNYGDDAYFYLGQVHHLNYNFEDAALAFITFQKQASTRILKKFDVDYWIAVTANARQSVEVVQNLNIESLHAIPSNAIESAFNAIKHGKFIYVPDKFRSKADEEMGYHSHMYLPNDVSIGDYLYFSRQSKKGKQGSELYRSQRISEEDYSIPETLGEILNTSYDEAYPYFDKASSTLYFSSKGHNTSGGFDIFKSQYNADNKSWVTPEKLDFPINSVHDDFLFTACGENDDVMFLTNRNCTPLELEAYRLTMPSPGDYVSTTGRDDVVTFALLSPSSVVIDTPLLSQINGNLKNSEEKVTPPGDMDLSPKEKYAMIIEEALEMQVQSDSLGSIAKDLRGKVQAESNYQTKQELIANITSLDKESKRLQYEADMKFKQASQIRKDDVQEQLANNNAPNITPVSTSEGITAYAYNIGSNSNKETTASGEKNYNEGLTAAKKAGEEFASSFDIMNSSPYSPNNPIPVASIPAGLVYRVQLGAYANDIPENTFGGLSPVSKEQSGASTKYFVGVFKSIGEARNALEKVKTYGYPDAFLVSFYEKNKISVQEAREIEFANR